MGASATLKSFDCLHVAMRGSAIPRIQAFGKAIIFRSRWIKRASARLLQACARRRWERQALSHNLAALMLQAYLRRTGSSARWMQAKALVNLTVKRLVTRQRYAQRVRRACEEQRELQALLLNVRGGDGESGRRAARESDDAFSELRALADDEVRIEYAGKCDELARLMLRSLERLGEVEQSVGELQRGIVAACKEGGQGVGEMQLQRKRVGGLL